MIPRRSQATPQPCLALPCLRLCVEKRKYALEDPKFDIPPKVKRTSQTVHDGCQWRTVRILLFALQRTLSMGTLFCQLMYYDTINSSTTRTGYQRLAMCAKAEQKSSCTTHPTRNLAGNHRNGQGSSCVAVARIDHGERVSRGEQKEIYNNTPPAAHTRPLPSALSMNNEPSRTCARALRRVGSC